MSRKLMYSFPGLPTGAGIYDDGNFYNCAPGQAPLGIEHEDDRFYTIDIETGIPVFDHKHPQYKNVYGGLSMVGIDLNTVQSEKELVDLMSSSKYGEYIARYISLKQSNRKARTLFQKMLQARQCGNMDLAKSIEDKLMNIKKIGLRVIS